MSAEVARKLSSDFSALQILVVRASKSSRARASSLPHADLNLRDNLTGYSRRIDVRLHQ